MIAQAELRQLPLVEKLALFELLWAEISNEPEQIDVPQWHKDILDERESAFQRGEIIAIDWQEAKKMIQQRIQ